jgi:excisionase family DNA binding protein
MEDRVKDGGIGFVEGIRLLSHRRHLLDSPGACDRRLSRAGERRPLMEPLLTVAEVATHLRVDRATVYRWTAERELPAIRLSPRKLRFDPEEIRAWLKSRRT